MAMPDLYMEGYKAGQVGLLAAMIAELDRDIGRLARSSNPLVDIAIMAKTQFRSRLVSSYNKMSPVPHGS